MKKLRKIMGLLAIAGMTMFLTGCGDDDDDDDDNGTFTPPNEPAEFMAQQFTLNVAGQPARVLVFPDNNTYVVTSGTNTFTGTYNATFNANNNQWTVNVDPDNPGTLNPDGTYVLTFTQAGAGTFVFNPQDGSASTSGSFSYVPRQDNTNPDDDDDPNPNDPDFAPANIAALIADTYSVQTAAGQRTLRFPAANTYELVIDGETESGNFTGTRTDEEWTLTLTPTGGGNIATVRLNFTAPDAGVWTFTPAGGTAETGTFTTTGDPVEPPDPDDEIPAVLTGHMLQLFYTGGGGERFDFTGPNSGFFEQNPADTVTYDWDPNARRIVIDRANPQDHWEVDLTFNQNSTTEGTFAATVNNQAYSGTFQLIGQ